MRFSKTIIVVALACSLSSVGTSIGVRDHPAQEKKEPPNLRLTLTTETTTWRLHEPARVRITIENRSGIKVELPSSIQIELDSRNSENEIATMAKGVFWSPISLTKTYGKKMSDCQNDLTQDRVEVLKGTNIVSISPPKDSLMLEEGEKKEFRFDLAKTCWNHVISSVYPNSNLFSLIRDHASRFTGSTKYKVYFELSFDGGTKKVQGVSFRIPIVRKVRSNEVEINFN